MGPKLRLQVACLVLSLVIGGCGEKAPENSFIDAPELKKPISQDEAFKARGMSPDQIKSVTGAISASKPGPVVH